MILLDAATVLLQWAVGGLAFLWFTTRRHEIGLGYAMLLRITYGVFAAGACGFGLRYGVEPVREVSAVAVAVESNMAKCASMSVTAGIAAESGCSFQLLNRNV